MYKPPKHTQEVKEHHDGATEIRAVLLVHGDEGAKAIHVHILDVESVIKKICKTAGLEKFGAGCKALFSLASTAADHFKDAHKIEITEHNVFGLLADNSAETEPQAQAETHAQPKKKATKKAAKKPAKKIDPSKLVLPTGSGTPPDLPPGT